MVTAYAMNYLALIWSFFYKKLLSRRQALILSAITASTAVLSISTSDKYLYINILAYFFLQYLMMYKHTRNWLLPAIFLIIADSLIMLVWVITYHFPRELMELLGQPFYDNHILVSILQFFLLFLCSFGFKKIDKKYAIWQSLNDTSQKYTRLGFGIFLLFLILMFLHVYVSRRGVVVTLLLVLCLMFVISTLLISLLTLINKNYQQKKYVENLTLSLEEERENFQLIREYRHDFRNIMLAMEEYLANEDIAGAQEFLEQIVGSTKGYLKNYHYDQISVIQNTALRGLVTEFIRVCEKEEIELNLKIDPISMIPAMSLVDFLRVFSILMNNAIEAVQQEKNKKIAVSFINDRDNLIINIVNPSSKAVDIAAILKKGTSNKKNHSGLGLWNLKKIIQSYHDSQFLLTNENGFFIAKLVLKY